MTMRFLICVAVSVLLLSLPTLDSKAFMPDSGPSPWGGLEFKPVVGHWSNYRMTPEGEKPIVMRAAVVGKEGDYYWYETVMTLEDGQKMITKRLVSGDPDNEENVKRIIMKSGDEPAMEMPVQMMNMELPGMVQPQDEEPEETETTPVDLGAESVEVPAGKFKAHHWQFTSEDEDDVVDAWVSPKVGPYGLVKMTAKDFEMVLLGHGDDATSLITETPQKMSMPSFPIPGMGGE
jgi:hypothetical protein